MPPPQDSSRLAHPTGVGPAHLLGAWPAFALAHLRGLDRRPPTGALPLRDLIGHGLAGPVFRALEAAGDPRAERLASPYRAVLANNVLRLAEIASVRDRLEAAGIPVIAFKGAAMQVRLYSHDLGLRPSADIDLLVRPADQPRALAAILDAGYSAPTVARHPVSRRIEKGFACTRRVGDTDVTIDLQQRLGTWPLHSRLEAAVRVHSELRSGWRIPSPVESICIIGLHHGRSELMSPGRELLDLALLAESLDLPSWHALLSAARSFGIAGGLWSAMRDAALTFGEAAPALFARTAELGRSYPSWRRRLLLRLREPNSASHASSRLARAGIRRTLVALAVGGGPARVIASAAAYVVARGADEVLWRLSPRSRPGPRNGAPRPHT